MSNTFGLHVNAWSGDALNTVLRIKPKVLKVLDLNLDALRAYRAAVPDGLVIYRMYVGQQYLDDPIGHANQFADAAIANLQGYQGLVDVVEGYNECGLWADAVNYNTFGVQLAKRLHAAGWKYAFGSFSEENPDYSLWHVYLDAIKASDYLSLHEYSAPTMLDLQGTRCLRYRNAYATLKPLLGPEISKLKILITEAGIDGGCIGQGGKGWRNFGTDPEQNCLDSVRWYDSEVQKDAYVIGWTFFCCGTNDPQWQPFNILGATKLIDGMAALPSNNTVVVKPMNANPNGFPEAVWKPSPAFGYPQGAHGRTQAITAIVDHIAQGPASAVDSEFANAANGASATYCVNKDGSIHQYVDEKDAAWANGIDFSKGYGAYQSDLTVDWIKLCWDKGISPNQFTISIEHEGLTGEAFTEAQYQADKRLQEYLVKKYNILIDANHILGHYRIDGVNRPQCPGTAYPWSRLFADLRGDLTMAQYLGAPFGGATPFSKAGGNPVGTYSEVLVMTFATGALWTTPDDGWQIHEGLLAAMTDTQVYALGADIWNRAGAVFVKGQGFPETWIKGLLGLRK